jgi:hypothetical protein
VLGVNRTRHRRSRFVSRAGLEPFAVCMERLLFALVFSHGARSNSRRGWSQDGVARQWSFATAAERSTTTRNDFHRRTDIVMERLIKCDADPACLPPDDVTVVIAALDVDDKIE